MGRIGLLIGQAALNAEVFTGLGYDKEEATALTKGLVKDGLDRLIEGEVK